jgi:hypothetical protein
VSILIVLTLGAACMFYGYVLLQFWREARARSAGPSTAGGIVALPESSALQMQLDQTPARTYSRASFGRERQVPLVLVSGFSQGATDRKPTNSRNKKATVHHWPGTKDAA